jgi:hypothetical protein
MLIGVRRGDAMGLVVCSKHGNGFMFVCPHIVTAVRSASACPDIQHLAYTAADDPELDDIELACWFCPQCIEDNHLPPNGRAVPDADEFINVTSALYRPMCPGCFKDWRAQGLG